MLLARQRHPHPDTARLRTRLRLRQRRVEPHDAEIAREHVVDQFAQPGFEHPLAFAFELRLNNALNLLVSTRSSIIDIALQCGFLSNSHFSRCFRNQDGKTPSQVREEASGKSAAAVPVLW